MERVAVDILQPFKLPGKLDFTSGMLDDDYHTYDFGPSKRRLKYSMFKQLTVWRAEHAWLRECPVVFGRGAIQDASAACRGVMDDNSSHAPYRRKDGRIILSSVTPPVRKGEHTIHIPGYGIVEPAKFIPETWEMRSFKIEHSREYNKPDRIAHNEWCGCSRGRVALRKGHDSTWWELQKTHEPFNTGDPYWGVFAQACAVV